jgi:uncharacterized protein
MKKALWVSLMTLLFTGIGVAQDITGDWQGTLSNAGAELRLVLHISKQPDGSLHATLDSIDQGANGIAVSSISFASSKLNLEVAAVHGSYAGTMNKDGGEIDGTWTQGQSLPLNFNRTTSPVKTEHKAAKPSDIDGDWLGTLDTGTVKLRVVFHINNTDDGLTATMDSPDQGMKGLPTTSVTRNGASLKIEAKQIAGAFEGNISKDLTEIDGTWSQGGGNFPLVLKRVKDSAELKDRPRPQNPVKPYPYREEEVSYENKVQHVTLAATFTIPQGKGPFPAVLLITGSGPQDRDETLMGHKPFLVLSDYLTRRGIAVLRADDRGVGKSTGDFAGATTADFATDTEAGATYLKTRSEVDPHKIGLIGHSEGGIIAPMVAARNSDVAFIVMMAGSGVPGDQILPEQVLLLSEAAGVDKADAEKRAATEREVLALVEKDKDDAVLEKDLHEKLSDQAVQAQLGAQIKKISSPWFRYFLTYDPATALRKVKCPVLVLNGEKDCQVSPAQNLPAIRQALTQGGNKNFEIDELPGLNHLFQTAKTGAVSEYAEIDETMSPVALQKIAEWILKQ